MIRVTKVTPGTDRPFDQVQGGDPRAGSRMTAPSTWSTTRANKLEDALSAGTSLDDMPGDLGLAGVTGTLDAQGNTPAGSPAPIPGTPALREAMIKAAFATGQGRCPAAGRGAATSPTSRCPVEDITPPALKPFDEVAGAGAARTGSATSAATSRRRRPPSC